MKHLAIPDDTHEKIKRVANTKRMKLYGLVDRIINDWLKKNFEKGVETSNSR